MSGGIYLTVSADMIGSSALMENDIRMAGYASLIGMSLNFAVMFRFKFRYSGRLLLLAACSVLIAANWICTTTDSVPVLVATCFVAGWFRMQATFICNSTIQLWITPVRDMAIFFCYVHIIVDSLIQFSGLGSVYAAHFVSWEMMQWIMTAVLVVMMILVMIFIRPMHAPLHIPLLGIDWLGAALWSVALLAFSFICVYGNYFDWWDAMEIRLATLLCIASVAINLWRATFLHHPYIGFMALCNRNVVRAVGIYLIFFTLTATEHVFEHSYATAVLGFDHTNTIDLNWYAFVGVLLGIAFTYYAFALRRWRYKTMTAIGFGLATIYLAYFYFVIDYNVEKEMLAFPLICRGMAGSIISTIFLTSTVQSGLPFQIFPQALAINGVASALFPATISPAIIGEWLSHTVAKNATLISASFTNTTVNGGAIPELIGTVQIHALVVSMKEIYGWLLFCGIISLLIIAVSYGPIRPGAIFPKWKNIKRILRRSATPE